MLAMKVRRADNRGPQNLKRLERPEYSRMKLNAVTEVFHLRTQLYKIWDGGITIIGNEILSIIITRM